MKKILLFGKNGQLGWELQRSLCSVGHVIALSRADCDFEKPGHLRTFIDDIAPDVIVNAAAYTLVDKAEEEKQIAAAINATAPGILAEEAKRLKIPLIHYSTDYVFDGSGTRPYLETDQPNPINENPISETVCPKGRNIIIIPIKIIACPIRIICLSFNLIAINPLIPRPIVIPMQNIPAKEAAVLASIPFARFK